MLLVSEFCIFPKRFLLPKLKGDLMISGISFIIGMVGLIIGFAISYVVANSLTKNKVELAKATIENENKERFLILEKENSQLKEKASRIGELESKIELIEEKLNQKVNENTLLVKQKAEIETALQKERESTIEKLKLLENSKDELLNQFKNLSNEILEEKSKKFTQTNKDNIEGILTPLKDEFAEFKKRVNDVYKNDSDDRTALKTQIDGLKELNEKLGKEALNLTNALKGDSQKQGAWGEVILERVLEESGLQNGREYETQLSFTDEEKKRKRPDAIVHLPNNKDVIIDSKVSIVAYQNYYKTDDLNEKEKYLKEHLMSIKNHIKGLSLKNYDDIEEIKSLDYVLMFIPIESAFMLAMENNRELFSEAFEKNIVIVTPSTLLVTLKTIQNIWRYERQNKNSQEIAKRVGDLHDKFVNFTESLLDIGANLDKAKNSFETALSRLSTGKGNLVSQVQKIKSLGIKSKKEISEAIIDETDENYLLDFGNEEENNDEKIF
ncbi:MAG: DNA recombination protein RmuC [Ignavibacteriales bacterium CG18_big_fil_WC_8_21_14_2_50_31_20]|nr:MAG: DNA recombination protein RmuC [Ignavibacteriales bacterium CG18_big_fil_WC_8_21_14_2_50_31_20]